MMIRIPDQYNIAALDMFYVSPEVRLKNSNQYPDQAEHFEDHCGRKWQRFSRHLVASWRPGVDGLPMFPDDHRPRATLVIYTLTIQKVLYCAPGSSVFRSASGGRCLPSLRQRRNCLGGPPPGP